MASGADAGMKITLSRSTLAAIPANAAAALPVLAVVTTSAPHSSALATAIAEARSLSEAVGWRPSSFTHTRLTPATEARRGALYIGVPPTVSGGTLESEAIGSSGP